MLTIQCSIVEKTNKQQHTTGFLQHKSFGLKYIVVNDVELKIGMHCIENYFMVYF